MNSLVPFVSSPLFSDTFWNLDRKLQAVDPGIFVRTEENQIKAEAEVPGFTKEQIDIQIKNRILTVIAERPKADSLRQRNYLRYSYKLAYDVATDAVQAKLENGILFLELPRSEADRPKRIAIT